MIQKKAASTVCSLKIRQISKLNFSIQLNPTRKNIKKTLISFSSHSRVCIWLKSWKSLFSGPMNPEDLSQYVVSDQFSKEYHCSLCNTFKAPRPSKVRNHLEAIHFPGQFIYSCDICDKTLAGRNALNIHKSTVHSKKSKF